ncbi:tellurite resistance TerB family protein [Marinigracilibium pacificum]|uniref:Co-chaperone DjlA N-terminal domain-containing protein n=1 Tax=Marinigracilibium pacificum TaxID=2729599 RepID=A0A848IV27_9BACT|nr:hypothetical protein [Marinigracilibium pacificum]NMM48187.1 hypothetical protein [Marinigracilibium pacificum]
MLFSRFFNKAEKKKEATRSYIKGLLSVASADSHLSYSELKFVYKTAREYDFPVEELKELIKDRKNQHFDYSEEFKFEHLKGIIAMASADGKISIKEVAYIKKLAVQMGYKSNIVEEIFEEFINKDSELVLI